MIVRLIHSVHGFGTDSTFAAVPVFSQGKQMVKVTVAGKVCMLVDWEDITVIS